MQKLDTWSTASDLHSVGSGSSSGGSAVSPVQFYAHRDHSFGGSLSKLERMKNLEPSIMEPFDETEEDESVLLGKELNTYMATIKKPLFED